MGPAALRTAPSWLINQVATHAGRLVHDGFAAHGARGYHYRLLAALHEHGPASQADLGRRCGIDRSDVVAALNELAARDLVRRTPDPDDRRRNVVTLTEPGRRELDRLTTTLDQIQDTLLAPLTPADRTELTRLLTALLDHHRQ
ncbi:MarR family winged helix-turn-helix transcriptional regulator [Micromonospora mirobrigensis]|uniref:DNA-binding transcriptional regulator, MarR family n=1 Tax=Micromonospora mirobrigensis TaxID=262898 RepID=A0A1C4YH14_9ACTN|nr:MarR family transcriptional regulator [Micromonospora mirobrigensis]SCF19960.1 DNA-binding transcriptional regulator, MarR family [Micromonospora mirobrigensis]